MAQYLLKMIQPVGVVPSKDDLVPVMQKLGAIDAELQAQGSWVFGGGLHQPTTATVVRPGKSDPVVTDGPFAEGAEYVGGIMIIDVADLDEALMWSKRYVEATGLGIETSPFIEGAPGA
ncbi:YciI family protein [Cumulibacter soli]|uniref:YciI family protein n=1 Tax=Cumulibacter soli TaxID=2546344 RepID=UPI00106789C0|nr:YciI family protein [Cumulibacter soli]